MILKDGSFGSGQIIVKMGKHEIFEFFLVTTLKFSNSKNEIFEKVISPKSNFYSGIERFL